MELKTEKVRPVGTESQAEIISKLCTQFALLVDEVGHLLSVATSGNQKLSEQVETLSNQMEELKERVSALEV